LQETRLFGSFSQDPQIHSHTYELILGLKPYIFSNVTTCTYGLRGHPPGCGRILTDF
jgi:hypothetical protein